MVWLSVRSKWHWSFVLLFWLKRIILFLDQLQNFSLLSWKPFLHPFFETENFLISKILFFKADFRFSISVSDFSYTCNHAIFQKKLRAEDHCCSGSWESHKIYSIKTWRWLATLIASILRNNKFCLSLARRNQSRSKKAKKNVSKRLRNDHTDSVDNIWPRQCGT